MCSVDSARTASMAAKRRELCDGCQNSLGSVDSDGDPLRCKLILKANGRPCPLKLAQRWVKRLAPCPSEDKTLRAEWDAAASALLEDKAVRTDVTSKEQTRRRAPRGILYRTYFAVPYGRKGYSTCRLSRGRH
jgi:hypothetical protein